MASRSRSRAPRRSRRPTSETLTAYLVRIKHIGPRRAQRLIDHYGAAEVLEAIDRDPFTAFTRAGLHRRAAGEAAQSWERMRVMRRLHLMLAPHGLAYLVPRIHEAFGDSAHRTVAEHPYELTSVFGVGFLIADRIAPKPRATAPRAWSAPRRHPARAFRGRAQRQHVHADRRPARRRRRATASQPGRPSSSTSSTAAGRSRPRGGVDLPPRHRRARGRAGAPGAGADQRRSRRPAKGNPAERRPPSPGPDAHRGADGGRAQRVRLPAVADHRRARHRQDGLDQDDRQLAAARARSSSWWRRRAGRRSG